jgi:branched-chain amino acid transport system ATP-binding protein
MNPTETAEMLEFIRQLKQRGLTILLIEHKLSLVMQLSDRVMVMDNGKNRRRHAEQQCAMTRA